MAKQVTNGATAGDARVFVQRAVSPAELALYYGQLALDEAEQSAGDVTPIRLPSSSQRRKWDIVDQSQAPQDLGSVGFTHRMDRFMRDIWWELERQGCEFSLYVPVGRCTRPDNIADWDGVIVYKDAKITSKTIPGVNPLDGGDDAPLDMTGEISFSEAVPIRSIKFGEVADSTVLAEALDGLYNDTSSCGDCGPASDGCQKAYILTLANSGSPGLSSQIIYRAASGAWATIDIPTLGGLSGSRLAAVGNYLVVISQAGGNHHYAPFADIDDGIQSFVASSSGYVAGKSPRAIWSKNPAQTFIAAQGGYIYLMRDPAAAVTAIADGSASTQDMNDISGFGSTIVAVGGNNAVLLSQNDGENFALKAGPASGVNLTAVWVMSPNIWFIGTGNGKLYYTLNAGKSYTQVSLPGGITVINDIQFDDDLVGYLACEAGGSARVYRTIFSGAQWFNSAPYIASLPSAVRVNFCVPCGPNQVLVGGRKTAGGDGVIAIAE